MKEVSSKEVKCHILNYNDLNKLEEFFKIDFKETIEGIFNALFILSKNYDKNKKTADYLIYLIKEELDTRTTQEKKVLIGPIIDYQNKINNLKINEKIKIKNISLEIQNIFNEIQTELTQNNNEEKIKCLEFLIFHDKNISMIENFINENNNILIMKDKNGDNILSMIFKKYLSSIDKSEKDYLYYIILIFLNSKHGNTILKNKEQYLRTIKNFKEGYIENDKKISKLLQSETTITKEELEKKYSIQFTFPIAILSETELFIPKEKERIDYTNQECITIDGNLSQCLDDAIYIEENEDKTYTLYIHIIDIPTLIPYASLTREEASYRSETIYLNDNSLPIYPNHICNDICSLIPNNIKNTITYTIKLDNNYKVIPETFNISLGKIKVAHRLTYEEADIKIKKNNKQKLDEILNHLMNFAITRRKENQSKELYREYENTINLEPYHESLKINSSTSANIIHETMILANYEVAKYFKEHELPYIYRKINIPSTEFLIEQIEKLKYLGTKVENNKAFLSELKDSYIESIYTNIPTYHAGLELDCYSHSTSPGRRYIDSFGQYIIHDLIIDKNIKDNNIYAWEYRIARAIQYTNEKIKQNEMFKIEYNYLANKKLIKKKNIY